MCELLRGLTRFKLSLSVWRGTDRLAPSPCLATQVTCKAAVAAVSEDSRGRKETEEGALDSKNDVGLGRAGGHSKVAHLTNHTSGPTLREEDRPTLSTVPNV